MSLLNATIAHTITNSPIGHIPKDYSRLADLCVAAHIRYRDEVLKDGQTYRNWRIEEDKDTTEYGRTALNHLKFCMLFDYIAHIKKIKSRIEIYNVILDQNWQTLTSQPWKIMREELAKKGVPGYSPLLKRKPKVAAPTPKTFDKNSQGSYIDHQ